jgi:glycerol-3-phosphate dehydrogenase (NAD(P)+)
MNYDYSQAAQIAFLGDLVLTCSSTESRNFTFGKLLVHNSTQKSLDRIGETIEGRYSVASVRFFEQKANIKLPLAKLIHDIINADDYKLTKKLFTDFILRP